MASSLSDSRSWSLVWADRQTAGRGRNNRSWLSDPGGLFYTVRYPLSSSSLESGTQLLVGAYTWIRTLENGWVEPGTISVKWPNDLLIAGRKIAGLLADVSSGMMLLGVGLNVNNSLEGRESELDRPATSLLDETGGTVPRRTLLFDWFRRFKKTIRNGSDNVTIEDIEDRIDTIGKRVRSENREGRAVGLQPDGGLILEEDGEQFVVRSNQAVEVPI